MFHAYTEDQLVEQPANGLFAEYAAKPHPHPTSPRGRGLCFCAGGTPAVRIASVSLALVGSRLEGY